jgi:Flp pilus assembly protein TadG
MDAKNDRGSALVETAIILPVLLLIVFGIFEFGRAMFISNTLNNAAREGARRAAVSPAPIDINAFVASSIPFDKTDLSITTTPETPVSGSGAPITVEVTLPFHTVTGLFPFLDNIDLKGEATMRYEL